MNLTHTQQLAIALLANSPLKETFYWTGGTLLAYHYLHHRKSFDLDFFSEKPFALAELTSFVQHLKKQGGFTSMEHQKVFDRHEFLFENEEKLRVEFVYYNHEKKTLKKRGSLLGVRIDSLEDIAANKTFAYFDRNEPKDVVDLYFLLHKRRFTSEVLLRLVWQKFGVSFNEASFWSEAFKCFPLLQTVKPILLETRKEKQEYLLMEIENYFRDQAAAFLSRNLAN